MEQFIGTKIVQAEPAWRLTGRDGRKHIVTMKPALLEGEVLEEGYRVIYAPDGYESWSPKEVFEVAYRCTEGMNFGLALEAAKMGKKIARHGWNGKGIYLEVQVPNEHSKMTLPSIYIVTNGLITDNPLAPKGCVPWLASQTDMLSDDWYVIE